MAQPPPYNRSTNFADYQAVNPNKPLPGGPLDEEFARVKQSLDGVLQNLKLIQRDDTALANKSVGYDQLKDEVQLGFNAPTEWEPEKNYIVRDTIFYDTRFYRCLESHVSSADFEADLNAGLWAMVADFTIVQTTAIAARDAALQAQEDAEDAQQAAEDARDDAIAAKNQAIAAKNQAIVAKNDAVIAKTASESARDASVVAKGLAEAAQADAEAARDDAISARNAAQDAQTGAENAADRAEQAASGVEYPVSYAPQTLNSGQKAQARANIDASERIVLDVVAPGGAGVGGAVPLTLLNNKVYTIRLNTLGTGTMTGAVYNLWRDSAVWTLKRLSGISGSNRPELRLNSNGDGLEVFTQHQNDYPIRLHIDIWDTNNQGGVAESFFYPAVSYVPQTLSPAEQGQARANIGVGNTFNTVAALLADETMSYTPGEGLIEVGPGDIIEAGGFRYSVAASEATDAHVETAGGVRLRVIARDSLCRTSQFGIGPSTDNLGQAITNAIKAASEVSHGLVFDTPGEYVITGKVNGQGRILAEGLNGFKLVVGDGVRMTSLFDIGGVDHVVNLFEFIDCNDVTICGGGEVDVLVADNPPASRVTFSVFFFINPSNTGPNNIRLKRPLKARIRGVPGFSYHENYAGYVLRMHTPPLPAPQPTGFVCDGVDFSGSSGRIVQFQGTVGAHVVNNKLRDIGADFTTVGIRALGDTEGAVISGNSISFSPLVTTGIGITCGTNAVGRDERAKNNLIVGNNIALAGGAHGLSLNDGENLTVTGNQIVSDGDIRSRAFWINTGAGLGIKDYVIFGNTLINCANQVVVDVTGTYEGMIWKDNEDINCGDVSGSSVRLFDWFSYGDGSIFRGEVSDPVTSVQITGWLGGGVPGYERGFKVVVDDIYMSSLGTMAVELKTVTGVNASALNYAAHSYDLSSGSISTISGQSADFLPISGVGTGAPALTRLEVLVNSRGGRTFGSFESEQYNYPVSGKFANNASQALTEVVLAPVDNGVTINNAKWKVYRL